MAKRKAKEAGPELLPVLERLADAAEALAGSDPELANHRSTEEEFDAALARAREAIASAKGG